MKINLILGALLFTTSLYAQTSAFTYQGRLNDQGAPATGSYDLQFGLWTAASGPIQVGEPLTNAAVAVSNGLFTVTLDFGPFPGADRWLEIGVRTNGGGAFTLLSPRQAITPTPKAIYSTSAGSADSVDAANISGGTVNFARLPSELVVDNESGVNLSGTFSGNGAGLNNLNATNLTGTISTTVLPPNAALRTGGNIFSGSQHIVDPVATGPQALDQQLTNSNTGATQLTNPWQSFTPGTNGLLTAVALMVRTPLFGGASSSGTIRIYAGEGTNGTLLASQSVTWVDVGIATFQTNSLSAPPQLQAGSKYTIQFTAPLVQVGWVYLDTDNHYAGGRAGQDSSWDVPFKTFMTPGATGQTVLMVNPTGYSGYVGIGTNAPQATLHVVGNILASGTIIGNGAGLTNLNAAAGSGAFNGTFSGTSTGAFTGNGGGITNLNAGNLASGIVPDARLSGNVALLNRSIQAFTGGTNSFSGNVGIGTTTPQAKLQVAGDVKLGNSGQYFAPAGEENLRIVRGSVSSTGTIVNGSGFTASRTANATFQVIFTTPFSSNPSIVVSCGAAGQALNSVDVAVSYNASTTGFNVQTGVRNTGYFDEPFSFIAVGPR
ncbi:MAG: hypothetical protein JWR69_3373 [Pedosphaera sp.]|nr:hypothetical protein [Pedosphaera sp.]